MQLFINGQKQETKPNINISDLLKHLQINSGAIAVELNLTIVPKKQFESTALKEGDKLEIISFIGGG
jgi:sulfur carrier protein